MRRLRTTFKRSRTPTGSEMKTQSSLDVPKQVRSASFDEIQLEAKRYQQLSLSPRPDDPGGQSRKNDLLSVPSTSQQRSKSFDSGGPPQNEAGAFLEVPSRKFQRRRSSGDKVAPYCIHCILVEFINRAKQDEPPRARTPTFSDPSTSDDDDSWGTDEDLAFDLCHIPVSVVEKPIETPQCLITVTLSPDPPDSPPQEIYPIDEPSTSTGRRRSMTSSKLERQQAFIFNETCAEPSIVVPELQENNVIVSQFFLTVPELKRDRAASVDSCFLNKSSSGKAEEVVPQTKGALLEPPPQGSSTLRSRSVDIVLPTDQQARYKALSMSNTASAQKSGEEASGGSPTRQGSSVVLRVTPDWGVSATDSDHLWVPHNPSTDFCYCGEVDCAVSKTSKSGIRYKCSSCKIICHATCFPILERLKCPCKPTFRDVGLRSYREQTSTKHHWVHRRQQKGKCKACGKSFQSKLSFCSKDIVAINCSWCKDSYHNKEHCFGPERVEEDCSLGCHNTVIVPPAWIVKLPPKGSFKSSFRKSPKKKSSTKKKLVQERSESDTSEPSVDKEERVFTLKPIPTSNVRPLIVFINPKSGGNQGIKLLQKFQWLLNPRQVFDLTQGGPRFGLEMFRKVAGLRILACGGDGTAGWVLSVIDQMRFYSPPAVGVLPLGTGNDLARALGWGGGYTDEPISKILTNIGDSDVVLLDRWQLDVQRNPHGERSPNAKDNLPLNVVNNYFSMGVDAHIALEFHEAREAHPEKFNSRLRNKMFYGQMGGKDLVKRKWKGLADFVTLICDGVDYTPRLKENKFHAIVFLNIPSYGGGTHPWPKQQGVEQSTDDGLIEVVGLTTYQLPLLQAGGHGTSICQCRTAKITTTKPIPMQVDGEACRLNPSVISLSLLNKAPMLTKRKGGRSINTETVLEPLRITIYLIYMPDYELYHNDKPRLKSSAIKVGEIEISPIADLENTRQIILQQLESTSNGGQDIPVLPKEWCFVDTCTAERFFRVDVAQEHLHYLTDIASDAIYILDQTEELSEDEEDLNSIGSNMSQTDETPDISSAEETVQEIKVNINSESEQLVVPKPEKKEIKKIEEKPTHEPGYISNLLDGIANSVVKAAMGGDIKKLRDLHGHGYSLLSIDSSGQTALHHSAQNGYKDVVKYLIASAPRSILNMTDNEKGETALHKAAKNRHRSICCMLVAGGASLSLVDNFGNTPRLLALEAKDNQLASYLESQEQFHQFAKDLETIS